jgi:hypothetical protein
MSYSQNFLLLSSEIVIPVLSKTPEMKIVCVCVCARALAHMHMHVYMLDCVCMLGMGQVNHLLWWKNISCKCLKTNY